MSNPKNIYGIVNDKECANCATCRRYDLTGLCQKCNKLLEKGTVVKIKETFDKDLYSCGCYGRLEDVYLCDNHTLNQYYSFNP